jgi:hypothetical protein
MKISTSPFRIFPLAFLLGALVLTSCDDDDNKEDDTQNGQNDPLTLGVTTNVDTLIESNEDEAILNFQFNETPPEDGVEVALTVSVDDGSSKPLARFKIAAFDPETDIQGGSLLEQPDLSVLNSLVLLLTEQQASVSLITNDDRFDNGPLNVSFSISSNDAYERDPDAQTATFTIVEN